MRDQRPWRVPAEEGLSLPRPALRRRFARPRRDRRGDAGEQSRDGLWPGGTSGGIAHVGAGTNAAEAHAPAILERNGLRIAFLGYVDVPVESGGWDARSVIATDSSPGLAWADLDQIASDVSAAKARADLVVVLMHSGFEYWDKPNRVQVEIAHTAIDAGAALVIGAHSHTLQGIEHYHGGAIAYSLGNFVFEIDQSRDSAMLKVNLSRAGVESLEWIPVVLDPNDGRPMIAEGEARQRILDSIERLSADLTGGG
ncbi:MAG: CapA family protein [Chloroflexi bacterium]|nr:CapA family protein [Chloroflexota bacterium]